MYLPRRFEEARIDVLHELVRHQAFGLLVTHGAEGLALRGKRKASQNRSAADCDGVVGALDGIGIDAARALAERIADPGGVD